MGESGEKKREEIWSAYLRQYVDIYQSQKEQKVKERYKTPRGRSYFELMRRVRWFLDANGIAGGRRADFVNFARQFNRIFWSCLTYICRYGTVDELKEGVDKLLDFLEHCLLKRYNLERELVGALEQILVEFSLEVYNGLRVLEA